MPYRRFLAANVAGALTWATTMGTLTFFFGRPVAAFLSSLGVWGLVAIAALLLARFAFRRWLRDRERRLTASKAVRPAVEYPRT
jgi:membrane protein DedA with SNARE-associated domain